MRPRVDVVWLVVAAAFVFLLALYGASSPRGGTWIWESNLSALLIWPAGAGLQLAWHFRRRGPIRAVLVGALGAGYMAALYVAMDSISVMLHPWAIQQPWLVPAIAVAIGAGGAGLLLRRAMAKPRGRGRTIALAQAILIPVLIAAIVLAASGGLGGFVVVLLVLGGLLAYYVLVVEREQVRDEAS